MVEKKFISLFLVLFFSIVISGCISQSSGIIKDSDITNNKHLNTPSEEAANKNDKFKENFNKEFNLDSNKDIEQEALNFDENLFTDSPIKIIMTDEVKSLIRFYSANNGRWLYTAFEKNHIWLPYMREILKEYGLPDEIIYLMLIESHFNFNARSKANAVGAWQFIKGTALRYGLEVNWWIDERKDPIRSTIAAARYLKALYEMFGDYALALAAYNTGELRIKRLLEKHNVCTFQELCTKKGLLSETKAYVPNFYAVLYLIRNNHKLKYIPEEWLNYSKKDISFVQISKPYSLYKFASEAGVEVGTVKDYNPELLRLSTPPSYENYILKIPSQIEDKAVEIAQKIDQDYNFAFKQYKVQKGDTLLGIAKKFKISSPLSIKEINHITNSQSLSIGQIILLPFPANYNLKPTTVATISPVKEPKGKSNIVAQSTPVAANKVNTTKTTTKSTKLAKSTLPTTNNKVASNISNVKKNLTNAKVKSLKYIIKKGDNLYQLAKKFNTTVAQIKTDNNLKNINISIGDTIVINQK